ncbi:hypothetical protein DKX38_008697 [Salix brachista]|uniref:Uncharacterized protein n=1 Tax=Salix brachista TaxID=2182728 RepID=A0A5N5MS71_9ROSI|nr:hypothetical protein DKX38_008697 [Salix brachista]
MEGLVKKYQQRFRKVRGLMEEWEQLQSRLTSQFSNASAIIEREEFRGVVLTIERMYRDGRQLVKGGGGSNQLNAKQLQLRIGIKPCLADCLDGLMILHEMHQAEYLLKSSVVSALSALTLKPSSSDLGALKQLLIDQPNIPREEGSNATIGETFLSMWKKRASHSEAYALGIGQDRMKSPAVIFHVLYCCFYSWCLVAAVDKPLLASEGPALLCLRVDGGVTTAISWLGIACNQAGSIIDFSPNSDFLKMNFSCFLNLARLGLANHELIWSISPQVSSLPKLGHLNLPSNNLTCVLPSSLGNLSQLVDLEFSFNHFFTSIPPEVGNLKNLVTLNLIRDSAHPISYLQNDRNPLKKFTDRLGWKKQTAAADY